MKKIKIKRVIAILLCVVCLQASLGVDAAGEKESEVSLVTTEDKVEEEKPEEVHYGWYQDEEKNWYYYDETGKLITGWKLYNSVWYYLDGNNEEYPGLMVSDTKKNIDGKDYIFDADGAMQVGWIFRKEGWYYASSDGEVQTGWRSIDGVWYYLDGNNEEYSGLMVSSCKKEIEGKYYFFTSSGSMWRGWIKYEEGWYYAGSNGEMLMDWQYINGNWYYLDKNNEEYPGLMVANCKMQIGEHEYYFNSQGAMRKGWYREEGNWYYYDDSGLIASGWRLVGNTWYYLDPDNENIMASSGWKKIKEVWYYFHSSGAMATNWIQSGGGWYYMASDGAMRTGWQLIDGNWYYFYKANDPNGGSEGLMARNTTIEGWRLSGSGAMLTGVEAQMSLRAQPYTSNTGYMILVDRSACRVGVFSGGYGNWNLMHFWSCSPGKASTPTVSGVFKVQSRGYYFDSGNARCYWYTQFYGDYLFHSVLYYKNGTLMDGRVGVPLSHGCVRLEIGNAKWIYDNIPSGTTVVIY